MKLFIKISLLLFLPAFSIAQQNPYWEEWNREQADSLRLVWNNTANDTMRMGIARSLGYYYMEINLDSSLYFLQKQDIGRVLLNLFNNAFYAVNEKNASTSSATGHYEPTVSVSTKKIGDKVEVRVKDNGNGIPEAIKEKIMQPFFTTKPTGEGTGLGLSLSYDIIKAHGGNIQVETLPADRHGKEGEGSEFIIQLPVK